MQTLKCAIDNFDCTAFRVPAFGTDYCLNHYRRMVMGTTAGEMIHPSDDYEIAGEDEF